MGLLLAVCALLLLGPTASLWAALGWLLAVLLGPRLEPAAALAMLGARPIARHQFPRGYAILDQLSRRAELPQVPTLYHMPSRQLNAFTVGARGKAAIAVTTGLLQQLNAREFAAVMAHEIGHIVNHDLWVMNLADTLSRLTRIMGFTGILLLFFGLPLLLTGDAGIGWILGALLLAFAPTAASLLPALSRTEEFDADWKRLPSLAIPRTRRRPDKAGAAAARPLVLPDRRSAARPRSSAPIQRRKSASKRLRSLQEDPELVRVWQRSCDPERPSRPRSLFWR